MQKTILAAIVTFILGAVLGLLFRGGAPQPDRVTPPKTSHESDLRIEKMERRISDYRNRVAELEEENQQLLLARESAVPSRPGQDHEVAKIDALVDAFEEEPTESKAESPILSLLEDVMSMASGASNANVQVMTMDDLPEGLGQLITAGMSAQARQSVSKKISEMSEVLGLTEAQQDQVKEVLLAKEEDRSRLVSKLLSGEVPSEEELAELMNAQDRESHETMASILSPDQLSRYQDYREQERLNQNEAYARSNLARLQTVVTDLTEDQKEQVFDHYYQQAESQPMLAQGDPLTMQMNTLSQDGDQGLNDVLTPSQLEKYSAGRNPAQGIVYSSTIVIDDMDLAP